MKTIFLNDKGQGIIELALALPLLLLLAFGIFEFGRAIYIKNVIINMSREGANLYSRDTSRLPQNIMDALAQTSQPLDMQAHGMIYLTQVLGIKTGPDVKPTITAQFSWDGDTQPPVSPPPSKIGPAPSEGNPEPVANVGTLDLDDGETAFIVEIFYRYNMIFTGIINYNPELYASTAF